MSKHTNPPSDDDEVEFVSLRVYLDDASPGYVMLEVDGLVTLMDGREARALGDSMFRAGVNAEARLKDPKPKRK